uniref:hydantoinase B/oxoprolinase family protein n=1 Tax=Edaphobacter aggregans TaxID=570835 RepID=UPI00054EE385
IVREVEVLCPARITLLTERRTFSPYGLYGGKDAKPGRTLLHTSGETRELPAKCSIEAAAGDRIRVETPGGGGWGTPA